LTGGVKKETADSTQIVLSLADLICIKHAIEKSREKVYLFVMNELKKKV